MRMRLVLAVMDGERHYFVTASKVIEIDATASGDPKLVEAVVQPDRFSLGECRKCAAHLISCPRRQCAIGPANSGGTALRLNVVDVKVEFHVIALAVRAEGVGLVDLGVLWQFAVGLEISRFVCGILEDDIALFVLIVAE